MFTRGIRCHDSGVRWRRALCRLAALVAALSFATQSREFQFEPVSPRTETGQAQGSVTTPELFRARTLLAQGNVQDAENAAREYVSAHKDSADGHYLLGLILFRKADARESLAEYTQGAKYRTPSAFDLLIVGSDYVELGDYADADRWFSKSLEFNPDDVRAWYYLGRAKYNENRFEEAIAAFQRCLQLDPKHVKAEDNLGLSYQAVQRTEEAKQAFRNAIAWQGETPTQSGPFIDMGALLIESDQAGDAVPYLEKGVAISPDEQRAHLQLGKAYLKLNRLPDAQRQLEAAEDLTPGNAPVHYMLGQVYRKEGLSERARQEFARYNDLNGNHSTSEPEPGSLPK